MCIITNASINNALSSVGENKKVALLLIRLYENKVLWLAVATVARYSYIATLNTEHTTYHVYAIYWH